MTGDEESIASWLAGLLDRATFAYRTNKEYPCTLRSYSELLEHPVRDHEYRRGVTEGSVLFPFVSVIAACLRHQDIYEAVSKLKAQELDHCTFQYWYPDSASEEHIYVSHGGHGTVITGVAVERSMEELLDQMFGECERTPQYEQLSAVKFGMWPLVLAPCRHYRLPVPLHLFRGFRQAEEPAGVTPATVSERP